MFFYFARGVMWLGMHLLFRIRITGREYIPHDGAFILCANHLHALDPVMLAVHIKRRLYFMAKKELFENKFNGFFLRKLGAFPLNRQSADMKAYKHSVALLNAGKSLLVFSQGTRMKEFMEAKNGAAMFALKTNTPIVPAGIKGSYKFFSTITIQYGAPVSVEAYKEQKVRSETVNELMAEVIHAVKGLTE